MNTLGALNKSLVKEVGCRLSVIVDLVKTFPGGKTVYCIFGGLGWIRMVVLVATSYIWAEETGNEEKGLRVAYLHTNYLWWVVAIELQGKHVG